MFGGGLSSRATGSMIQEANEETLIIVREVSRRIMAAFLALNATILTSFLHILNKHLLRDARPALVAWITNAASLPILFFFSSRRRHTRFDCDWSSDVCSSD